MLAATFLTPKHPVQSARSFIDFIRWRSVKTGPNLQLNQALHVAWDHIWVLLSSSHWDTRLTESTAASQVTLRD